MNPYETPAEAAVHKQWCPHCCALLFVHVLIGLNIGFMATEFYYSQTQVSVCFLPYSVFLLVWAWRNELRARRTVIPGIVEVPADEDGQWVIENTEEP